MDSFDETYNNEGEGNQTASHHPFGNDGDGGYNAAYNYEAPSGDNTGNNSPQHMNYHQQQEGFSTDQNDIQSHDDTYGGFNSSPNPDHDSGFPESNGDDSKPPYDIGDDTDGIFSAPPPPDGPLLPEPNQMREEAAAFREWRRKNTIYLEEKEKKEKEMREQIFQEAEQYKKAFYDKRNLNVETNKAHNREREKLYLSNQEKFHKEADKQYWKAIAEIIPYEVANIEKRGRKKDEEKKPSIHIIQGPKPGKPTDMSRMRQIITKLKQHPPPHMLPPPPPPAAADAAKETTTTDKKDANVTKKPDDPESKTPSPAVAEAAAPDPPKASEPPVAKADQVAQT
ncbi:clathrin light chain 2-like [Impatiens glandulifera]|uniref:clathrin light chain 2-like n=1 Tax=Impatiens glandulifera TaxID=253017 RepID=UPI001FB0CA04|nr:clathrin light chain 2-like [Impatiens glandulifera]